MRRICYDVERHASLIRLSFQLENNSFGLKDIKRPEDYSFEFVIITNDCLKIVVFLNISSTELYGFKISGFCKPTYEILWLNSFSSPSQSETIFASFTISMFIQPCMFQLFNNDCRCKYILSSKYPLFFYIRLRLTINSISMIELYAHPKSFFLGKGFSS